MKVSEYPFDIKKKITPGTLVVSYICIPDKKGRLRRVGHGKITRFPDAIPKGSHWKPIIVEEAIFVGKDVKQWDNKRLADFIDTFESKSYISLVRFSSEPDVQQFKVNFIQDEFDLNPNNRMKIVIDDIAEEKKEVI